MRLEKLIDQRAIDAERIQRLETILANNGTSASADTHEEYELPLKTVQDVEDFKISKEARKQLVSDFLHVCCIYEG